MDKSLVEAKNVAVFTTQLLINRGPALWNFTGGRYPSRVKIGASYYGGDVVANYATNCKRDGNYTNAINAYVSLLTASVQEYNEIPVAVFRGYYKVLICANIFEPAFEFLSAVLADMQSVGQRRVDVNEWALYHGYWETLAKVVIDAVDRRNLNGLMEYCQNFSGNVRYIPPATNEEIMKDVRNIREKLAALYGM